MNKFILLLVILLSVVTTSNGQNLFYIGEKSYVCTETFELQSNSNFGSNELNVLIAKDGAKGLFVVSIGTMTGVLIRGKLIIYLNDGTVISCTDKGTYDYVNNVATTVYYLTAEEITKMKSSNINTVRYALKCGDCSMSTEEGNFSASNKTFVPGLIKELFD